MLFIAVALGLGFVIGSSVKRLAFAVLCCGGSALLISCGLVLLPYAWNNRELQAFPVIQQVVAEAVVFAALALVGMALGRRRARKGWGA
jgi:hypothetical protein